MQKDEFLNCLKALRSLDRYELANAGVLDAGDEGAWVDFSRNPVLWIMRAPEAAADKIWDLIAIRSGSGPQISDDMFQRAWLRSLGGKVFQKRHLIDALVLTTEHMVRRARDADRLEAIAAGKRNGIYIASKVALAARWRTLRAAGLPIISTWIDEAGQGESADLADLWRRCIAESSSAEVLIVYREPEHVLKGAWIEVGAALACGVPVYGIGIDEFTVAKDTRITLFSDLDDALIAARGVTAKAA